MLASVTPLLLFAAFILLLLVSVSVPIVKTIYLFKLVANVSSGILNSGANGSIRFGVWGYCISSIDVTVFGEAKQTTAAQCTGPQLGYSIDSTIASTLNQSDLIRDVSHALTAALVLHPIACGLTFLTLLISMAMIKQGAAAPRLASLLTLGLGLFTALITTIVFFIDVGLVATVRDKVNDDTNGDLQINWGNAVWMVLGAACAIWASLVGACAGVCFGRRKRDRY